MTPRWTLGRVLPCLMLIAIAIEVTLRLVAFSLFADRPYEALRDLHTSDGPFKPNAEYHTARSYGDLAALGNLPERRLYHRVDFATDAFGFHNAPSTADVPWAGILFGDSFAIGAEVPEEKALSVQLSTLFSGPIYNAGGYLPLDIERLRKLSAELRLHRGVFLYEFHEAHLKEIPPLSASSLPTWRHKLELRVLGPTGTLRLKEALASLSELRLSFIAQKFVKSVENDAHVPDDLAGRVIEGRLRNGDWMLFLRSRTEPVDSPEAAINRWADFFLWLSGELGREGLELVVIIVPDSSTVYAPLLASPTVSSTGEVLLGQLEGRLRHGRVPVVNVTPAFRAAASQLAERHQYLYWQDDTHWNACGVTIATAEFRAQLSGLLHLPRVWSQDSNSRSQFNCESQQMAQNSTDCP